MSPHRKRLVCIVDDDSAVRELTRRVLESAGFAVATYPSAEEFLAKFDEEATSCIATDLRMPNVDGMQLQKRLHDLGSIVSLVVVSGYADVRTTVRLMEEGAMTLLEKPYLPDELVAVIKRAVASTETRRKKRDELQAARHQLEQLTDEERAVLDYVIAGLPNKAIALKLEISLRTVDRRRQALLTKMAVQSPTELAALVARLKAKQS